MALFKNVNGTRVQMTAQEEADFEAARAPAPPSTDPRDHDLDYAQWSAMLVDSGLDDVLSGAAANAKATNRQHAKAITFAIAKAQQRATYSFARMMELVTTFAAYIPAGSDVTEATLTTHWMAAKDLA